MSAARSITASPLKRSRRFLLHTAVYAGIPIASEGFRRADAVIKAVAAEKG